MKLEIVNGKFTLKGELQKPPQISKSGKSEVFVSTHGATKLEGYSVNLNIYKSRN